MPTTLEKFKAWLKRQPDDPEAATLAEFLDDDPTPLTSKVGVIDFTATPQFKALQERLETQAKQIAEFAAARSGEKAEAIVERLFVAGKLLPAQRAAATALFSRAVQDDEDAQTVSFCIEGQADFKGNRAAALEALFSALPGISLTEEKLGDSHVVFSDRREDKKSTGLNPYAVAEDYKKKQMGGK